LEIYRQNKELGDWGLRVTAFAFGTTHPRDKILPTERERHTKKKKKKKKKKK